MKVTRFQFGVFVSTVSLGLVLMLFQNAISSSNLNLRIAFGHLDNPYFPDIDPVAAPLKSNYVMAPTPENPNFIRGERLSIPVTLRSTVDRELPFTVTVFKNGTLDSQLTPLLSAHQVWDVTVEGNTNRNCGCPAGKLPQVKQGADVTKLGNVICIDSSNYDLLASTHTNQYCNRQTWEATQAKVIRRAPFQIKDPLMPVRNSAAILKANRTELILISLPIPKDAAPGQYSLVFSGSTENLSAVSFPFQIVNITFTEPALDLAHWFSFDPRDLEYFSNGDKPIDPWGPDWWSEAHWSRIQKIGSLLYDMGNRTAPLPHYVTDNALLNAQPLVPVKCITGDTTKTNPNRLLNQNDGIAHGELINQQLLKWNYKFDFNRMTKWVEIFKGLGFTKFSGLPFSGGDLNVPNFIVCDLYVNESDPTPYLSKFIIRRTYSITVDGKSVNESEESMEVRRQEFYKLKFIKTYLGQLKPKIESLGLNKQSYAQHLIDETEVDNYGLQNYDSLLAVFREAFPGYKVMDTLNKLVVERFSGVIDVPILNNGLLSPDQWRTYLDGPFLSRKLPAYFYNTSAGPEMGVSRNLDASPVDMRALPLFAAKYNFSGYLYWTVNAYRFPKYTGGAVSTSAGGTVTDEQLDAFLLNLGRDRNWTPYNHSINPNPGGNINPGQGPGAGWVFYPTKAYGLVGSLRAERFYRGMIDHWLYSKARAMAESDEESLQEISAIRSLTMGIKDDTDSYSINPLKYDEARERLINLILKLN